MYVVARSELPAWAEMSDARRAHVERVVELLDTWAIMLDVPSAERQLWLDAGLWHDALRDANEAELRSLVPGSELPVSMLHGPAAATRLAADRETRVELLEAIRWHTVGCATWGRAGRALYMADFLEPGRKFAASERAFLAKHVPADFDGVFREVVRQRLAWTIREGKALHPPTVELWNAIR